MGKIKEEVGDIFASPRGSILIHACNAKGVWGAGVALQFKKRFPHAYREYQYFCNPKIYLKSKPVLVGRALLISPDITKSTKPKRNSFYIACLITSEDYGKNVDSEEDILRNTRNALNDLNYLIEDAKVEELKLFRKAESDANAVKEYEKHVPIGDCRAVRINSGKFGVPWKRTKSVLKDGLLDIVVVRPKRDSEESEDEHSDDSTDHDDDDSIDDYDSAEEQDCETSGVAEEKFKTINEMTGSSSKITSTEGTDAASGARDERLPKGTKRKPGHVRESLTDKSPSPAPKAKHRKKRASEVEKLAF